MDMNGFTLVYIYIYIYIYDTCAWTPNNVLNNPISNLMMPALVASEAPEGNLLRYFWGLG